MISVLVSAYNIAPFITECLDSVLAQTFQQWEGIVVDDGSTDGTDGFIEKIKDSRIRMVRQANSGVSAARNAGLALAEGEYVLFLDGDDTLHPTALERLNAALEANPASVAVYGTFRMTLKNGEPYPGQKPLHLQTYPTGNVLAAMLRENFLANGGHILLRANVAKELGGFNAALKLSEDWEFWCRLAAKGSFTFIGNQPELFYLRVHPGSSSRSLASQWENHIASIECVLQNPGLASHFSPQEWRRLSKQILASHLWEAGRVNFTRRQFAPARSLMLRSLIQHVRLKRVVLFAIAQVSQLLNKSFVTRLRFNDLNAEP